MKRIALLLAGAVLALFASLRLHAQMQVDSLDGPVTSTEVSSFASYLQTLAPATADGSSGNTVANLSNEYAQGASGERCKAMGLMYEISGDLTTLNRLIFFCDTLLSQRNDLLAAPNGQVVYWSGNVDPAWNSGTGAADGSSASGDSAGHLANCARLILLTPAIWNTTVPDGDPHHNGATYLARAKTYIQQADVSFDSHYFPYDLDLSNQNHLKYSSTSPYKPGLDLPWNQMMMITYPLQNLAADHAILGDNPGKVTQYDSIVQTNIGRFFSDSTVRTIYTDSAGNTAYDWAYTIPNNSGEDSNHGSLDTAGFYRAYTCGRYGITAAQLTPFANMVVDVLTGTIGSYYHGTVEGTDGTGHAASTTYLRSGYFLTAEFRPDQYYNMVSGLHITAPGTTTSVDGFSRLMFIKNRRYLAANNFALSVTPTSGSVNAGGAINYTISVSASGSFNGTVNLSVSGLPSGATATLSPASVNTAGNSVLTVTTSGSTPNGTYPLTITGSTGTIADTQTIGVSQVVSSQQVATPSFSPGGGSYGSAQSVTISSSTSGASIRYTTDGSTPSETAGTLYSGPVNISATATLKAIAYETGYSDSTVTSATYTINTLPAGWSDTDVGTTGATGSAAYSGGTFTVNGSGSDIYGTSDQFNYAYVATTGDTTITARVATQQNTNSWAKSGVMFRETTAAGSSYVGLYVTPSNGADMQYRNGAGTSAVDLARGAGIAAPYWVRLVRSGNTFTGYTSADGNSWTQIGSIAVTMASGATAGLPVCSHAVGTLCTSTFTNVTVTTPTPAAAPTLSPAAGSYTSVQSVTISTTTSGASIRYTTDGSTPSETAGTLYAGPVSVGTSETLKAIAYATGYADSSVSSAAYTITLPTAAPTFSPAAGTYTSAQSVTISTTTSGASIRYTTDGSTPSETAGTLYSGPVSVGVTETLNAIAYETGHSDSAVSSAAYTINSPSLPGGWSDSDIGAPPLAGSASYSSGIFTVNGCGADIYGTSDQFNFTSNAISGDTTITAHITAEQNTNGWAKCGVMYRETTAAGSSYVGLYVTPSNGVDMQYRNGTGTSAVDLARVAGIVAPYWVRLVRANGTFTGYISADGSTWTQVGSVNVTMASSALVGLAVCSHNTAALNTTTFDSVKIAPSFVGADIGAPPIAGSTTLSGSTYTVNGCGADIYGTADQFQYAYDNRSGNVTITARVASQANTNAWAKSGVMIRETTAAGSSYVGLYVTPSNGIDMQYRNGTNTNAADLARGAAVAAPYWLRIVRSSNTFTGYSSPDGVTWTQVGSISVTMATNATVGLAVCSHNTAALNASTFDNLTIQ